MLKPTSFQAANSALPLHVTRYSSNNHVKPVVHSAIIAVLVKCQSGPIAFLS